MKTHQLQIGNQEIPDQFDLHDLQPQLFLIFGGSKILLDHPALPILRQQFPEAKFAGCSTAGEISGTSVNDDTVSITAVEFEKTNIELVQTNIDHQVDSEEVGRALIQKFPTENLRHILVFSDGLNINGTELVHGMRTVLPENVAVTGGLAGDGPDFKKTFVIAPDGTVQENIVVGLALYNPDLKVGYGSLGGWDTFGIERRVTKSEANVLYEIDDQPALELYKSFLGDQAKGLPASGLLFPLSMRINKDDPPIVRTILAVDEESQSLTFAGNIPKGAYVKLMKANIDRLINGAEGAAKVSFEAGNKPELAVLISCVGRKLVLKQLVEEEVEAVQEVIGDQACITGFYSYGEIAPFLQNATCELHNQTMTITTLSE
ncbi:MAG: FIST C-terminal domain-containing protein [Phaeodactylibacter sp.]|nr:FIST C-terminal domain-containing protein [Phaeodactylibacter sp.]